MLNNIEILQVEHVRLDHGLQLGMLHRKRLREITTTRSTLGEAVSQRSTPSPTIPVAPKRRIFMYASFGRDYPCAQVLSVNQVLCAIAFFFLLRYE